MGSIISGWVWGGTEERLRVVCRIDKVTEIEVVASQYRPDVRNAGYGDGYSGFSLQIPERLCDRQEHWLELLVPERPGWSFPGVPAHAVFGIPEIRVAQIGPNHTQAYADYWMRHLQSELGTVLSQESIALYVKNQLALLGQSNNAAFALWANGGIVGSCTLEGRADAGYNHAAVLRILLLRPYCGKRLGGSLLAAALDYARVHNLRRVELTVNVNNLRAHSLYLRFGFKEEGVLRDNYYNGQQYSDELLMSIIFGD